MRSTRPRYGTRVAFVLTAVLATSAAAVTTFSAADARAATTDAHDVVLIGNSASGTVSFLDGHTFKNLGSMNIVPDLQERLSGMTLIEQISYAIVKDQEGGDRFADDVYVSPNGKTLYVSRGNLNDVVAFDIASRTMLWRFKTAGIKADHAALSPDGTRLVVSATTAAKAQVIDTATGLLAGEFATGTYPHQNDYSADGSVIYNSSIGVTLLPKALNLLKGAKQLTVVDAKTYKVLKTYAFDYGVRPSVFTADGTLMYTQLSYLNGFVEFNLATGKITKTVNMPFSAAGAALDVDKYPQNSAHHGLAFSGDEKALCDVGTIDDYTAIVTRPSFATKGLVNYPAGSVPYWATASVDGTYCLVTLAKRGEVSVVSFATATEVARIPVGTFPQRERRAKVLPSVLASLDPAVG